jgi:hypothetical protein
LRVRAVPVPPRVALDSPADVLAVLAEQANAVRADAEADPLEKARTLGLLAGLALRAMEARDLDARLEAVERVLKLRQADERALEKARRK